MCVCLCVCLCVCVCPAIHFHILQRIFSKFGGNIVWVKTRIYIFSTHNARACACVLNARACVHSLIFVRILSNLARNILRLTIRTFHLHAPHACVGARVCESVRDWAFAYLWTDSLQICGEHTTHHKLQGLRTFHVHSPRARMVKTYLSFDGFSSNLLGTYNKWPQVTWATYLCSRTRVRVINCSLIAGYKFHSCELAKCEWIFTDFE
jgi:hypothetical protein